MARQDIGRLHHDAGVITALSRSRRAAGGRATARARPTPRARAAPQARRRTPRPRRGRGRSRSPRARRGRARRSGARRRRTWEQGRRRVIREEWASYLWCHLEVVAPLSLVPRVVGSEPFPLLWCQVRPTSGDSTRRFLPYSGGTITQVPASCSPVPSYLSRKGRWRTAHRRPNSLGAGSEGRRSNGRARRAARAPPPHNAARTRANRTHSASASLRRDDAVTLARNAARAPPPMLRERPPPMLR